MGVADHLIDLSACQVPDSARAAVKRSLFDWAVCGIAGAQEPVAVAVRQAEGAPGPCTLLGATETRSARAAALINGAVSHALDYDDTHFGHIGHPSVVIFPAALAVAEELGTSSTAFEEACALGFEASIRFGLWLGRAHYQTGFHQTGTAGAFGATLAAARLRGLSGEQIGHALGLCATRAAGLKSQFGTMGKPLNAGFAAAIGVECAALAAAGVTSDPVALDRPQGFGPTHAGEAAPDAWDDLGAHWHLEAVSYKFHACCHGLHAMLEALAGLGPVAGEIEAVQIETHPRWLTVCNQPAPDTGLGVKFSYAHTAAMALCGVPTGALESFSDTVAQRADLVALRQRVTVTGTEGLSEMEARVSVTAQGATQQVHYDLAQPLEAEALTQKLQRKGAELLGAERAGALWQAISPQMDLPRLTQVIQRFDQ